MTNGHGHTQAGFHFATQRGDFFEVLSDYSAFPSRFAAFPPGIVQHCDTIVQHCDTIVERFDTIVQRCDTLFGHHLFHDLPAWSNRLRAARPSLQPRGPSSPYQ